MYIEENPENSDVSSEFGHGTPDVSASYVNSFIQAVVTYSREADSTTSPAASLSAFEPPWQTW